MKLVMRFYLFLFIYFLIFIKSLEIWKKLTWQLISLMHRIGFHTSICWWLILIHSNEDSSLWSVWIKNQGDRVRNPQMIQKQQGGRWNLLFQLFPDSFWFLFVRRTHYMRSLLFEQSQEDVCVEVGKSLQHQEQDPSPVRNLGQRYPQAFPKKMGRCGELLLLDPMLLKSKNHTECLLGCYVSWFCLQTLGKQKRGDRRYPWRAIDMLNKDDLG